MPMDENVAARVAWRHEFRRKDPLTMRVARGWSEIEAPESWYGEAETRERSGWVDTLCWIASAIAILGMLCAPWLWDMLMGAS